MCRFSKAFFFGFYRNGFSLMHSGLRFIFMSKSLSLSIFQPERISSLSIYSLSLITHDPPSS
jgi:hypothetical protein